MVYVNSVKLLRERACGVTSIRTIYLYSVIRSTANTTLCSAVAIVKSYTPQSVDLMWLMIELMTLDIFGMGYGKIAERVA